MALTRVCNARKMLPAVITTNCLRSAVVVHRRACGQSPLRGPPTHPHLTPLPAPRVSPRPGPMHANHKRLDGYISYNCKLEDELAILDRIEIYKKYMATNYY